MTKFKRTCPSTNLLQKRRLATVAGTQSCRPARFAAHNNEPVFDLHKISQIFKRYVSLSYRLLRYLNSAAFSFRAETNSIPMDDVAR